MFYFVTNNFSVKYLFITLTSQGYNSHKLCSIQGWVVNHPTILTSSYNRLKLLRSVLPKVVNTGQLKILVVDWSYIWSMNQLKGLKNNCFVIN